MNSNHALLSEAKNLLADGQTAQAIELLQPMLDADRSFSQLARMLRVVAGNFQNAKLNEQKGILSVAEARREYALANDSILSLIESVEMGKIPASPAQKMRRGLWIGVGLAAVVFVAVLAIYPRLKIGCPEFADDSKLKIMLLPFESLDDKTAKVESILNDRLEAVAKKRDLPADCEIHTKFKGEIENLDPAKAERVANHCAADLVVWGKYLQLSKDSIRLSVRFKFAGSTVEGETGFQNLQKLDLMNGQMDKSLTDVVFSLCARLAILKNKKQLAKDWILKMAEKDAADQRILEKIGS